jgi:hypothetical protein
VAHIAARKENCCCLPSHSAHTNTILLYSTRSVSTHGVGNCLVEINLPTLPLSCSRLESRRVNRSRSMVIRSSLPAYLSNILFDLGIDLQRFVLPVAARAVIGGGGPRRRGSAHGAAPAGRAPPALYSVQRNRSAIDTSTLSPEQDVRTRVACTVCSLRSLDTQALKTRGTARSRFREHVLDLLRG